MGQDDETFAPSKPLLDQLYENDSVLLAETERELVFGLIGQFWKLTGDESIHLANAQEFLDFDQPDYAKAAANFIVSENDDKLEDSRELLFDFLSLFDIKKEDSITKSYLELIAEKFKR